MESAMYIRRTKVHYFIILQFDKTAAGPKYPTQNSESKVVKNIFFCHNRVRQ